MYIFLYARWYPGLYATFLAGGNIIECFHMTSRRPYWCLKTMKRRPCWCPKPVLWELNSFLMQTLSFVPINLHICWPREWKHSINYTLCSLSVFSLAKRPQLVLEISVTYRLVNYLLADNWLIFRLCAQCMFSNNNINSGSLRRCVCRYFLEKQLVDSVFVTAYK